MKGGDGCGDSVISNIFIILALVGISYVYIYTLLLQRVDEKVKKGIYKLPYY